MKILFVNYEFPPLGGGGGRANAQIARRMAAMGHEVHVLTSAFKGLKAVEAQNGYTLHRIPTLRRRQDKCTVFEMAVFMFSSLIYGVRHAARFRPDACIAFFTIPSGPAAFLIRRFLGIPYIVSLRGGDVPGFMGKDLSFYHALTKPLIRLLWKSARAVVANSEGLKDLALETTPQIPIRMIPNGVDAEFFNPLSTPRAPVPGVAEDAVKILTVGRLNPQKGLNTLLTALANIRSRLSRPVRLLIVGDGPLRKELEAQSRELRIDDLVLFLGWQEPEAIRGFYASADFFVLSSLDEGMPNVVLEAMAMGLPILGTDVAGTRDLVIDGKNGRLIPAQDIPALENALFQLIERADLRRQMGQASLEEIKRYDWQRVAREYVQLCEGI